MRSYSQTIFEENQVLWAKVRGYPWWPAYVCSIQHGQNLNEHLYTVIFFGDDTNSQLGTSKLRKFSQHYNEFHLKSRNNKKLKQSIQKALEKLKQNSQDISMYLGPECSCKQNNNIFSYNQLLSVEEINKSQSLQKNLTLQNAGSVYQQQENSGQKQKKQQQIQPNSLLKQSNNIINTIKVQNPMKFLNQVPIRERPARANKTNILIKQEQHQSLQDQQQNRGAIRAKSYESVKQNCQNKQITLVNRKRFKKKHQIHAQQQKSFSNNVKQSNDERIPKFQDQNVEIQQKFNNCKQGYFNLSQKQIQLRKWIEVIKSSIGDREKIIQVLIQIPITIYNVEQLLNLNISQILQKGPITKNIHLLLSLLQSTLLLKYFPDDIKIKKRILNFSKQKTKLYSKMFTNNQDCGCTQGINLKQMDKNKKILKGQKQKTQFQFKENMLKQIRVKTTIKLQKMIKKFGLLEGVKQLAVKIQNSFKQTAELQRKLYRQIAYKKMRNIKDYIHQNTKNQIKQKQIKQIIESIALGDQSQQIFHEQTERIN